MSHLDPREPALFMLGESPCLCLIESHYQLYPILNKSQTEDLGKRPANDDFYPSSSFYRGTPQKSMTSQGSFGWE
jgi:hypothetical protein